MKNFINQNWFKLLVGSSLLIMSLSLFIFSISTLNASSPRSLDANKTYSMIPINPDGSISVKLTETQIDNIIPKNPDGSINVKFSESQLKKMETPLIQSVNIQEIGGISAAFSYFNSKRFNGGRAALIMDHCTSTINCGTRDN